MKKPTLRQQLEAATHDRDNARLVLKMSETECEKLKIKVVYLERICHFHDRLIEGVCAGLKETANFPRNR